MLSPAPQPFWHARSVKPRHSAARYSTCHRTHKRTILHAMNRPYFHKLRCIFEHNQQVVPCPNYADAASCFARTTHHFAALQVSPNVDLTGAHSTNTRNTPFPSHLATPVGIHHGLPYLGSCESPLTSPKARSKQPQLNVTATIADKNHCLTNGTANKASTSDNTTSRQH